MRRTWRWPGSTSSATPKARCRPPKIRDEMQRTMQADCAVFRTERTLAEGMAKIDAVYKKMADIRVTDRSLIWNTDLVETLELDNLHRPGGGDHALRRQPQGKPRRAHARGLPRARRQELDEAHASPGSTAGAARAAASGSTTARSTNTRSPTRSSTSSPRRGCIDIENASLGLCTSPAGAWPLHPFTAMSMADQRSQSSPAV